MELHALEDKATSLREGLLEKAGVSCPSSSRYSGPLRAHRGPLVIVGGW